MIDGHGVLCVIPARGGSKGVPRKNIKHLAGKPLIAYSIEQAMQSSYIDRVIVSTEDEEIAAIAKKYGAEVPFLRPVELAGDDISTIDVLLHAMDWIEKQGKYPFDILTLLHTTAPLRWVSDIDACIKLLIDTTADNVFSVADAHRNPYFNMVECDAEGKIKLVKKSTFSTRQAAPKVYDLNASIYAWWKDILKKEKKVFLNKSKIYVMPKERSVDIDDDLDFRIAEFLCKNC
ncbi:MAG: acylneuraminate cytidylyltransferase family protein [Syntrophales bacterium]|nr:acylneuraminate cytidylyltransferase family protein [Syntrophales bacterium]